MAGEMWEPPTALASSKERCKGWDSFTVPRWARFRNFNGHASERGEMSIPNITPLHVKVYILLGRASFRLCNEGWNRDRKIQAIQAEAAAALEVEQLRSRYQVEGLILPRRIRCYSQINGLL